MVRRTHGSSKAQHEIVNPKPYNPLEVPEPPKVPSARPEPVEFRPNSAEELSTQAPGFLNGGVRCIGLMVQVLEFKA